MAGRGRGRAPARVRAEVLPPRSGGDWTETNADSDGWLTAVYRDEPLVTELAVSSNGNRVTVSSSTKPGLMVRMLEALDVRDGHRVLEIGTGTGYNAALLSHRLGSDAVFSVDIGQGLVDAARVRLAEVGFAPTLVVGHGGRGLPEHAPFDRVVATCSLPAVPWAWAEQVREGGLVLVDLKPSAHAGNLVLLTRYADRLEGRFLPRWAGFMAVRDADRAPKPALTVGDVQGGVRSTTRLDPLPWSALVPWFLAQSRLPGEVAFGYRGAGRDWAVFSARDGSWCAVRTRPGDEREVRRGGPVDLWGAVESAHEEWAELGRPGWERLGVTVTPDGVHRVWLDDPGGPVRWTSPSPAEGAAPRGLRH